MVGFKDKGATGNFEVKIDETEEVIHSNRKGEGKAESLTSKNAIALKIQDALDNL